MRFVIVGAGAIGGYMGARMARAGLDVILFARGAHLAAMQARGIRVQSAEGDFEVRPTTPWNYGLVIAEGGAEASFTFEERPIGDQPFSPAGAGVVATAKGQRIPDWKLQGGWAGEISTEERAWSDPARPITTQPVEDITLLPYGCTNLRITEFPRLSVSKNARKA